MRFVNPIIGLELRTPLARVLPWAILSFDGRRSGRRIQVVIRMYTVDGALVSFSPNAWRANFVAGHACTLRYKGKALQTTATLVRDHAEVARVLNQLLDQGLWVPAGLRVRKGERFQAEQVAARDTLMLRFA